MMTLDFEDTQTSPAWKGSQSSHASEFPGRLIVAGKMGHILSGIEVILFIFQASFNLASTCALFPAITRLEMLLAAAG